LRSLCSLCSLWRCGRVSRGCTWCRCGKVCLGWRRMQAVAQNAAPKPASFATRLALGNRHAATSAGFVHPGVYHATKLRQGGHIHQHQGPRCRTEGAREGLWLSHERVRELQRGPHPWLDTRVWIQHTTRPLAPLPLVPRNPLGVFEQPPCTHASRPPAHATSPPLTSSHARPLVSARHSTLRQPNHSHHPLPPQHEARTRCAPRH
jgi:hypothetical protein